MQSDLQIFSYNYSTDVHNVCLVMCSKYKAKRLRNDLKLKILKPNIFSCLPSSGFKKMTVRMYIYILCNSRWEKFGDIRNNLFGQTGPELLDH